MKQNNVEIATTEKEITNSLARSPVQCGEWWKEAGEQSDWEARILDTFSSSLVPVCWNVLFGPVINLPDNAYSIPFCALLRPHLQDLIANF